MEEWREDRGESKGRRERGRKSGMKEERVG